MSAAISQPNSARIGATGLQVGYGDRTVIDNLDISIPDGKVTTIVGPNGCGKSTLLRSLVRLLKPTEGTVLLDGTDISSMRTKDVARIIGLLPQNPVAPEGLTVSDLVSRGRHPHQSWYRQWSPEDEVAVTQALEQTNCTDLADRTIDELSGGQRQRVWIALTLAQQTDIVMLDEPTTYLDLSHSIDVLDLVDDLCHKHGKTVIMVLHDLNLAVRYSDWLIVMRDGEIITEGPPAEVITTELLEAAFGLRSQVLTDPVSGGPMIVPIGRKT